MVEHVYSVFSFGSENLSWAQKTLERLKKKTKAMNRLFRFKREKDEAWSDNYTRTCKTDRKIWGQLGLPFLLR